MSVEEKVRYLREVSDAMAHMNDKGYVHADMKPTNIMVTGEGQVKVIDLGQAPDRQGEGTDPGTPGFMALEQAEIQPLSERTDVYNFGATIYWMLTNQEVPTAAREPRGKAAVPPGQSVQPRRAGRPRRGREPLPRAERARSLEEHARRHEAARQGARLDADAKPDRLTGRLRRPTGARSSSSP